MDIKAYQRKEITNGLYQILGANGKPLTNHNHKPYPLLSEKISKNFIEDLNAINDKNRDIIFKNNSEEEALTDMALHNSSNSELNDSLCYCLISTLMEYEAADMAVELEFEQQIQWDRLFRLTPEPPLVQVELKNTLKAREFFGDDYKNLPLNYCSSIEEMEENKIELVSDDIINKVSELVQKMTMAEIVMVNILYTLYHFCSITLPILWVAEKIGDEDFIAAQYALNHGIDIYEVDKEKNKVPRFEMNRLLYLKTIKFGYLRKDQTLPCVNF